MCSLNRAHAACGMLLQHSSQAAEYNKGLQIQKSPGDRNLSASWFYLFLGWPPCWCCYLPSTGGFWMFWLGRDLRTGSENNCLGLLRPIYVATTGHWLRNPFSFYSIGSVFVVLGNGSWAKLVAMANSPAPDLIFLRVAM